MNTPGSSHETVTPRGIDLLPSGRYRARIPIDGRQRSIGTYRNITAAVRAREKAMGELAGGSWVDPKRSRITLDDWMGLWWGKRSVRPSTLEKDQERYRVHIEPYLGGVALCRLTPFQVHAWHGQLARDGRTPVMVKKAHTLLQTALGVRGALGDGRVAANPCVVVRPYVPPVVVWRFLSDGEVDQIIGRTVERWQPLVTVLADTGIRWSEAMGLQREDFNPLRREITVRRSIDHKGRVDATKNRRERVVPASSRAVEALNIVGDGKPPGDRLFTAVRGGLVSASNFRIRVWQPACGPIVARVHDLRHSCASRLLASGATVAEVRDMLGHSSITVTERYLHVEQDQLANAVLRAFG